MLCDHLLNFLRIRLNLFDVDTITRLHLLKKGVCLWKKTQRVKCADPERQPVFSSHVDHHHTRKLPTRDNRGAFFEPFEEREKNFLRTLHQQNFLAERLIYWIVQCFNRVPLGHRYPLPEGRDLCFLATAVFSESPPSYYRSTLGGQARPFDIDSSVYVSIMVRTTFGTCPLSI